MLFMQEFRGWCVDHLSSFKADAQTQSQAAADEATENAMPQLLARLRHTTDPAERQALREALLEKSKQRAEALEDAATGSKQFFRSVGGGALLWFCGSSRA